VTTLISIVISLCYFPVQSIYLALVSLLIAQVIPQAGELFHEDVPSSILCKPKILPLKSVTLEKLEKMQKEAQDAVMEQEALEREQRQNGSF